AKVLLRTLLSRSSEECPTVEVDRLQSGEEDSQDESPVESIPIRETKAYQLLKQSATQERQQSSGDEEEEDLSGKARHHPHHHTPPLQPATVA
ncbi:unnamed protein product, partial [Coregonus sp. 'balchen']